MFINKTMGTLQDNINTVELEDDRSVKMFLFCVSMSFGTETKARMISMRAPTPEIHQSRRCTDRWVEAFFKQ